MRAPARELAAQRVELGRATLALARDRRLALAERGEMADQERRRQHHGERDHVLRVGNGERIFRRHEQEIEQADAEHRREHRRSAPEARRDEHGAEQIDHDDVGALEAAAHQRADAASRRRRPRAP